MKNTQKGFIMPVILVIIALLVIGGGVYYYSQKTKSSENGSSNMNGTLNSNQTSPLTTENSINNNVSTKNFLSTLKGEVVYLHRDGGSSGDLNIYKISATGDNNVLLYKNSSPSPLISNRGALKPKWSNDGSKISFASMPGEFWSRYSMNSDGSNVVLEENYDRSSIDKFSEFLQANLSREKDLVVDKGSIYFIDSSGARSLVYKHQNYNDYSNPGASEASWSPDKKYVIFMLNEHGSNEIMIVSKDGTKLAKLADGRDPDWKYDNIDSPISKTPVSTVVSTAITSPLSATAGTEYTLSGTAALSVGSSLYIELDGGTNVHVVDVQSGGTWSLIYSGFPAGRHPIVLRSWNTSTLKAGPVLTTGTLTVTDASAQ